MTCIVSVVDNGVVYMGGDSAGVAGYSIATRKDEKVFKNGDFVFGFTSSFRMGQVLRYAFNPPVPYEGQDLMAFMVTSFVDSIRNAFKSSGYAQMKDGAEVGGCFLVGYRGRLFKIEADYQVGESADDYAACGCGDDIAYGSLFSTIGKEPNERIKTALEAASKHSAGVSGPFVFVSN